MGNGNGWDKWGAHVLSELGRQNDLIEELRNELTRMSVKVCAEISALNVKSGVWGLIGGLIPAVGILLILVFRFMMAGS